MTFKKFNAGNKSGRTFSDISSEFVRSYLFAGGGEVQIDEPIALHVSKSGHYVADRSGVVTFLPYGPNGWLALRFKNRSSETTMTF